MLLNQSAHPVDRVIERTLFLPMQLQARVILY